MTKGEFLEMTKREQWDMSYVEKMLTLVESAKEAGFNFTYSSVLPQRNTEKDFMTKEEFLVKAKSESWDKKYVANVLKTVSEVEADGCTISYDIIIPPPNIVAYN